MFRKRKTKRRIWTEEELLDILVRSDTENFDDSEEENGLSTEPQETAGQSDSSTEDVMWYDNETDSEDESEVEADFRPQDASQADIKWSIGKFRPVIHPFETTNCGNKTSLTPESKEIDFFTLFFSYSFVSDICEEVNRFKEYCISISSSESEKKKLEKFKEVTTEEFYTFIALTMLMPQIEELPFEAYWDDDELISTPFFSRAMDQDRYMSILRLLHFSDNSQPYDGDRLYKVRKVVDHLKGAFRAAFTPYRNLCIEESLLLFSMNYYLKEIIPTKRSRFGIKTFVMCDCKTGYILDFIVCAGTSYDIASTVPGIGKSGDIVSSLISPYLGKGHTLYVNECYSSPNLFSWLHEKSTNACGTVRKSTKYMPVQKDKLLIGEVDFRSSGALLAVRWKGKREIRMLTTSHKMKMVKVITKKKKKNRAQETELEPAAIADYMSNMDNVIRTDVLLSSIAPVRKAAKWYKNLYFHLLDLSILNAHSLYQEVTKKEVPLFDFHKEVIRQLINSYHPTINLPSKKY